MADPSLLGVDWTRLGAAVAAVLGAGGGLVFLGKLADKRWSSADARLTDRGAQRRETMEQDSTLREELRQERASSDQRERELREEAEARERTLRQERDAMHARYMDAEERRMLAQSTGAQAAMTAELLRERIGRPGVAGLVPSPPMEPAERAEPAEPAERGERPASEAPSGTE